MFRKRKSKNDAEVANALANLREIDEARDVSIHERTDHADAYGPTPNGHLMSEPDEEQEPERAFNVAGNDEVRPATEGEATDKVSTIWLQRLGDDPEGALDDLQAKVKQLGYQLAYAGRTFGAPVIKRTYYIIDTDKREPIEAFDDGEVDLTLLDVCLWSELAFKKWKNS